MHYTYNSHTSLITTFDLLDEIPKTASIPVDVEHSNQIRKSWNELTDRGIVQSGFILIVSDRHSLQMLCEWKLFNALPTFIQMIYIQLVQPLISRTSRTVTG